MRKQTQLEEALENEVYVDRLLVLLEDEKGFRQVRLTKSQFKAVSDACINQVVSTDTDGFENVLIALGNTVPGKDLFEGMRDFYEQEEI